MRVAAKRILLKCCCAVSVGVNVIFSNNFTLAKSELVKTYFEIVQGLQIPGLRPIA
jgi:hypothetical protein